MAANHSSADGAAERDAEGSRKESAVREVLFIDDHGQTMQRNKRVPTHPGEVLLEEFLVPMELSQVKFAAHIGVPVQRVNEIVRGRRGVSPESAWLLAQALGTTPEFWVNLQTAHDLAVQKPTRTVKQLKKTG